MNAVRTDTRCRVCLKLTEVQYTMRGPDGSSLVYYLCGACGTIFHGQDVDKKRFTAGYLNALRGNKHFQDRLALIRRVYFPIIEERMYGRTCLDVGFGFTENIVAMRERGWVADGIDLIENDYITGDFEDFDFGDTQYDLIIMSHVLASFQDPMKAIEKAAKLLHAGGMIFIMSPDASLCLETGYSKFGHWAPENRTITTLDRTILECVKAGFEPRPLVQIQNLSKRFVYFNDFHLLMKKGFR